MMAIVGMISRIALQFQQYLAHACFDLAEAFAGLRASCHRLATHYWTPRPLTLCLMRDPHSYRSGPHSGQPVPFFGACAKKCRNFIVALVVAPNTVNSLTIEIVNKGTKTCLRKLGLSQQLLLSLSQVVSKLTCSAALLAQPLVQLPLTRSAQTKQQQHLLAPLLACCVTTLASAARPAKIFRATPARQTQLNSRQGSSLAAVLRSKDTAYV